jgi:hypothetical protein
MPTYGPVAALALSTSAAVVILAAGCDLRSDRMRPAVGPPATGLGADVVRAVEVSSTLSMPSLRVVTPEMLRDVQQRALTDAGAYGAGGRYVMRTKIVKLEGGGSGIGFNRYALVAIDNRVVDDRDPAWDWHDERSASPGLLPIPGQTFAGVDAQREAFEAAVRDVAGETARAVRDTLERRSKETP